MVDDKDNITSIRYYTKRKIERKPVLTIRLWNFTIEVYINFAMEVHMNLNIEVYINFAMEVHMNLTIEVHMNLTMEVYMNLACSQSYNFSSL